MLDLIVNIVVFVVAIIALAVARETLVDARKSGAEQQKILEASRNALNESVFALRAQLQLSRDLQVISRDLLVVTSKEHAAQSEFRKQKPDIQVFLEQWALGDRPEMSVDLGSRRSGPFRIALVNNGEGVAEDLQVIVSAEPRSVVVEPAPGQEAMTIDGGAVRIGPIQLPPFRISRIRHESTLVAVIPPTVNVISWRLRIRGRNLADRLISINMKIVRSAV